MNKINIFNEFKELGCEENEKCSRAFLVIQNLTNAGTEIIEKKYLKDLGFIYLIGKDPDGKTNLYLPVSSWHDISLFDVDDIQQKLCHQPNMNFLLAVCDSSGIVLYYSMKSGWPAEINKK